MKKANKKSKLFERTGIAIIDATISFALKYVLVHAVIVYEIGDKSIRYISKSLK